MPPHITLHELYAMRQQKQKNRSLCFDRVVELCHRRIRTVATYGGMNTFYEVPGMLIGYPLFNVHDCAEHLIGALRKSGFLVQILPPPHIAVIYISWDPQEIKPKTPALTGPVAGGPTRVGGANIRPKRDPSDRLRLF